MPTATPLPLITLEEHFFSAAVPSSLTARYAEQLRHVPDVLAKLTDLGSLRRRDMDAGGVTFQVISHAPGLGEYGAAVCREANDQLADAVKAEEERAVAESSSKDERGGKKGRFAGFAVLPMCDPVEATAELRRAVTQLGFVGALVDNHCAGKFYDGEEYDVLWAAAEELGVPVYLHPNWPSEEMRPRYEGGFSNAAASSMGSSGWAWHSETGLHVLRLFASGLFDRRPRLKIIVGHMGEMIPFMLGRVQRLSPRWGVFQRNFKIVYDENIWITTSGVWSVDPLRCILANTRLDHILYSVDYPFTSNEAGLTWIRDVEESGLVDGEQLKAIAYGNAEKLLGVKLSSTT